MEDLAPLVMQIQSALEGSGGDVPTVVIYSEEPYGVANDFYEVLNVFLPNAEIIRTMVWSGIETGIIFFLKSRFKKPHEKRRPRKAFIYGPNGEILRSVTIESEDSDPKWDEEGPHRDPPAVDD